MLYGVYMLYIYGIYGIYIYIYILNFTNDYMMYQEDQ